MDLRSILVNDIPLIDVRAPVEFGEGHFPTSINLPLMNDEERRLVGTCYRHEGQVAAIALGHSLVNGVVKQNRVDAWKAAMKAHPQAMLYCFRGGLRSQISKSWIEEAGTGIEVISGGYKALRNFILTELERLCSESELLILSGRTGAGKTEFLAHQPLSFIDLEKCANHRGSSFGEKGLQPAQVTFENAITIQWLKSKTRMTLIEDESPTIGKLTVSRRLFEKMKISKIIVLERSLEDRAERIIQEYVLDRIIALNGDSGAVHNELRQGLERISKKLGGLRFQKLKTDLSQAFQSREVGTLEPHRLWVSDLIAQYYDPLYSKSLDKRREQVLFQGDESGCVQFIAQYNSATRGE